MQLIRGRGGRGLPGGGCVVTIGSYDGIHLGHRALLARLAEHAVRRAEPSVLLTFEPLPREYLVPDHPPARLTSLRERWRILLSDASLGYLWLLRFGEALRNLPAEAFAQLLAEKLRARVVVVGHDFRFARRGEATAAVLAAAGVRLGFQVDVVDPVMLDGERISSSGVRAALADSDFERARRWLGRPWSMRGRVVAGERRGRKLGFPTANLPLERRRAPVAGISRCASGAWPARRSPVSRVSARGRPSGVSSRSSRRTYSISAATSTGASSRSNSPRSCAMRRALRVSWLSPRSCGATPTTRAASSRPDIR